MALQRQSIWGWKVATYLFFAGIGAGGFLAGVVADFLDYERAAKIGAVAGPLLVGLSTAFLLWDLGKPLRFWRAGTRPHSSWIARGVYILTISIVLSAIYLLLLVWPSDALAQSDAGRRAFGVIVAVLSIFVMAYTGFLLGANKPIPLWRTPMLPLLFVFSGASTGVMAVAGVETIWELAEDQATLQAGLSLLIKADSPILIVELVILWAYLALTGTSSAGSRAVQPLLRGELAAVFWLGVLALGVVVPLLLEWVLSVGPDKGRTAEAILLFVATGGGTVGGFLLRYVIVAGGSRKPLVVLGQEVPLPGGVRLPRVSLVGDTRVAVKR